MRRLRAVPRLAGVDPAPADDPHRTGITERNLAAVWSNYEALGRRRLVYTNTVSLVEEATIRERLARREIGSRLAPHIERSVRMARLLADEARPHTVRIATDGKSVEEIATRSCWPPAGDAHRSWVRRAAPFGVNANPSANDVPPQRAARSSGLAWTEGMTPACRSPMTRSAA
ncbi:hypothetical protein ACRAKI_10265 [Saccharothrix isguenensis]